MRIVVIPNIEVIREASEGLLPATLGHKGRELLWEQMSYMIWAARHVEECGSEEAQRAVWKGYRGIRALIATDEQGRFRWPEGFWPSIFGKAVFYTFWQTFGEDLLVYPKEAAPLIGIDRGDRSTMYVGALQAAGLLDYLVDPDAAHPRRRTRMMIAAQLAEYLAWKEAQDVTGRDGETPLT